MCATAVQEEGPSSHPEFRPLRLSRIFRPDEHLNLDEKIPIRRKVAWGLVWVGIVVGIALYFTYARLLTPLLAS